MWGRWYVVPPLFLADADNSALFKGLGAMTEWRDIVKIVVDQMKLVLKENKS
jgi:hypothetical protein